MHSRTDLARLASALNGLPILGCLAGSPAAEAGLRYGDILLAINDVPTESWDDFLQVRGRCKDGFTARIFRAGVEHEVYVPLRPSTRTPLDILSELMGQEDAGEGAGDPGALD
jgi:S1-C subfamily serine protease